MISTWVHSEVSILGSIFPEITHTYQVGVVLGVLKTKSSLARFSDLTFSDLKDRHTHPGGGDFLNQRGTYQPVPRPVVGWFLIGCCETGRPPPSREFRGRERKRPSCTAKENHMFTFSMVITLVNWLCFLYHTKFTS